MAVHIAKHWLVGAVTALAVIVVVPPAQAQDFFSSLFRGFERPDAVRMPLSENFRNDARRAEQRDDFQQADQLAQPRRRYGGRQAFCVRTCDGRHFPVSGSDRTSRAAACNSLCPSAETRVVYGSDIDNAATESGKPYSELPNAFRYRDEIVAGCTCNGKDAMGLARIEIEDDPTLRKGDIVRASRLVVASADQRGASVEFSPASGRIKARPEPLVVAGRDDKRFCRQSQDIRVPLMVSRRPAS